VKENPSKKGRKAQHEGGEVRGVRAMTQADLIAAALEEEERNKESLRDWLRKEEERRELRRVGRKRVKGPRWTWVSRTVGKAVELVQEVEVEPGKEMQPTNGIPPIEPIQTPETATAATPSLHTPSIPLIPKPVSPTIPEIPTTADLPYTRNYLILSQIPGGLPAEFSIILGQHAEWDSTKYIPARNRPLVRRPPLCPFTGLPAKYRHPGTGVGYATVEGYGLIEAMLRDEYVYNEQAGWLGREDEGMDEVDGWSEAVAAGWAGQRRVIDEGPEGVEELPAEVEVVEPKKKGRKRKSGI
jgi:hypothetical protein